MVFVVIRVSGAEFAVDDFLDRWNLEVGLVWRKGELSIRGRVAEDSGFSLCLPDADSWKQALPSVQTFLRAEKKMFEELRHLNIEMELDIGVTVGEEKSFAPSLKFPIDFLTDLISSGIDINVSAYPASDEN